MVKNFYDFGIELLIESLILESKIEFSDNFMSLISSIKDNRISKELVNLKRSGVDASFAQNFIDIGNAKDEVTFTPERRAKEYFGKDSVIKYKVTRDGRFLTHSPGNNYLYKALGYVVPSGEPYDPSVGTIGIIKGEAKSNRSENIYAWFVSDDGRESVINKSCLVPHDDKLQLIYSKYRNNIKIGRLVRAILTASNIKFVDKEIENFVNSYKAAYDIIHDAFSKFKLVSGDEIAHWYHISQYETDESTLGSSCMAEVPPSWLDIYSKNPSCCSLLILFSDSGSIIDGRYESKKIKGRALVWKTDQGETFMDRIYYNNDSDVALFKNYAFSKGWWCRVTQSSGNRFNATNGSASKVAKYSVKLEKSRCENYPYVDSLNLINFDGKLISNSISLMQELIKARPNGELCDTDGGYGHDDEDDY